MATIKRKKEIIDVCLATFMENGLVNTPTKDLCKALNMQTGGIFYYFETKDEIVLACAEEATVRIEKNLMSIVLKEIETPDKLVNDLRNRAISMRPLMKFFVSVCATPKYDYGVQHLLDRLSDRYKEYIAKLAEKLFCSQEEVAPHFYTAINTIVSYMLFGKQNFVAPQLDNVYLTIKDLLIKRNVKKEKLTATV